MYDKRLIPNMWISNRLVCVPLSYFGPKTEGDCIQFCPPAGEFYETFGELCAFFGSDQQLTLVRQGTGDCLSELP